MKLFILQCRKGPAVWYLTPTQGDTLKPKWALKFSHIDDAKAYLEEFQRLWMYEIIEMEFEDLEATTTNERA